MGRTSRKADQRVPRKRVITEAPPLPKHHQTLSIETSTVILAVIGLFILLALCSALRHGDWGTGNEFVSPRLVNIMGPAGGTIADFLLTGFGTCSFVFVLWIGISAIQIARKPVAAGHIVHRATKSLLTAAALLISTSLVGAALFGLKGGGKLGAWIAVRLVHHFNEGGTLLIGTTMLLICIAITTGIGLQTFALLGIRGTLKAAAGAKNAGNHALFIARDRRAARKAARDADFFSSSDPSFSLGEPIQGGTGRPGVPGDGDDPDEDEEFENEEEGEGDEDDDEPNEEELEEEQDGQEDEDEYDEEDEDDDEEDEDLDLSRRNVRPEIRIHRSAPAAPKGKGSAEKPQLAPLPAQRSTVPFELPSPGLLVRGEASGHSSPKDKELVENSRRLEQSLLNFRIGGRVVEVQPGPVITLYEFEPAPGVKVQRIITLSDDLALALKVASVRVYAPVPGKGTVGIEVPNANREIVRLRDLIETEAYQDPQQQIALALGKDTFGETFVADLAKMPHLLIAGATGTGKSVCINSLLLSLLYRNSPTDLRLLLIDPKMLELSVYEDIPHLKAPVVTQAKRARGVLWWAVEEMERRYSLMKELGVRSLASYNALVVTQHGSKTVKRGGPKRSSVIELTEHDVVATAAENAALAREADDADGVAERIGTSPLETLPRIVIVVDELADLMLTVGREIEELLTRLAQKARAAGIHLILATQRPSVNVITGLIKANFPSRVSFKVATRIDSRTVLDCSGAEKLLGQGDMLYLSGGAGRPKRLHSPFVSDKEVHDVVSWIRKQGKPDYDVRIESMIERLESAENSASPGIDGEGQEYDPLYDQALNLVAEKGFASTSMVQRVFRIGYNRAARILETMEREGVVGPADGAKPRQVLVPTRGEI